MKNIRTLIFVSLCVVFLSAGCRDLDGQSSQPMDQDGTLRDCPSKPYCFQIVRGYWLFWEGNSLYVVSEKEPSERFTYHILLDEGGFLNRDFDFQQQQLVSPVPEYGNYAARLELECEFARSTIRLGQYKRTESGYANLWGQEIDMARVMDNELLLYNGGKNHRP